MPASDAGVSNVPPVPGAFIIAERVQAGDAGVDGGTRVVLDAAPDASSPLPPIPDGGVPPLDAGPARKPSR